MRNTLLLIAVFGMMCTAQAQSYQVKDKNGNTIGSVQRTGDYTPIQRSQAKDGGYLGYSNLTKSYNEALDRYKKTPYESLIAKISKAERRIRSWEKKISKFEVKMIKKPKKANEYKALIKSYERGIKEAIRAIRRYEKML